MLTRVAKARGLPVKRDVPSKTLSRAEMLARVLEEQGRGAQAEEVDPRGDALAALGLVPSDYDFIAGSRKLLEGQIVGFYSPFDGTMYLASDLNEIDAEETLAHELVHALQDQSYSIDAWLGAANEGDSDRLAAMTALLEGDAMSAGFDVTDGSAFNVSAEMLRRSLALSATVSAAVDATPRVLEAFVSAPYADGFGFVQELRRRGGWRAVDDVWRSPPLTTEQLLHIDKFDAREPALEVASPPLEHLGAGWRSALSDRMGEQGLRVVFEEWTSRAADAERGAAGWGGDRYVVARKDIHGEPGRYQVAVAWRLRFDTEADAKEAADIVAARFGEGCSPRSDLGPIAWRARGADIAIAAGPFERLGKIAKSTGTCEEALKWAEATLKGDAALRRSGAR
jgi:hypothetical protein